MRLGTGLMGTLLLGMGLALAQSVTFAGRVYHADDPLPADPSLQVTQLENGLALYLLRNGKPAGLVEYALALPVGSLSEADSELGLAHFLQHIAFTGTERFPARALRELLEETGMDFGPDLSAYTSWTETVYTLQAPIGDRELTRKAVMLLADWAQRISFDPEAIEKERKTVMDEERRRLESLDGRLLDIVVPLYFGDSYFARRLPSGDMKVIAGVERPELLSFYRRWYRPELMAVIAVGDADPGTLSMLLQGELEPLAPLSGPAPPRPPPPLHNGPAYGVFSDPDMPLVVGLLTFKAKPLQVRTVADFRDWLERELFVTMVSERLAKLLQRTPSPVQQVYFARSELAGVDFYEITLVTSADAVERAFRAAAEELNRICIHGFDPAALDSAKRALKRRLKEDLDARTSAGSAELRKSLIASYLNEVPFTPPRWNHQAGLQLLKGIVPDEVSARARLFAGAENRIAIVLGPEREKAGLPRKEDLAALLDSAFSAPRTGTGRYFCGEPPAGQLALQEKRFPPGPP